MYDIIPFRPKLETQSYAEHYPFLFSTTHGNAHLGLVLNGYGFISSENFKQSLGQNQFAKKMYQESIRGNLRKFLGERENSQHNSDIEENIRRFEVVFYQSNNPLTSKEIEQKQREQRTDKMKFESSPHRLYTCQTDSVRKIDAEELCDYLDQEHISLKEFIKENIRRQVKDKKKRFFPQLLTPFETLECLAYPIIKDDIEYKPNFEKIKCYYGTMQRYTPEMKVPKRMQ